MTGAASAAGVWRRSRERLARFGQQLTECGAEAAAYGKCVSAAVSARDKEVKKDLCAKEFETLKMCLASAAKNRK
ncbi:NADH dehydrogenase [ubiquinone] 1 alpha subcomplex assembly factor 8 [Microcaecilia unicolor]|uniref:NADH dehydrogenase [ubiquinone] 1 alpha subcomplex assembly factor 8 n=1 Tax=Microcaecilia unicolor TaxID=1415580 RepID=A0A6P7YN30_9AMPH|nr:NADH dehydrogenase [ubiquinone] 1 alpha subcomplex assembly factor 8-like [Microcaecilia unicolor]XP_030064434.1 NADH dehydrogenase [ubiquinone] 1 alpha subcomplex assembly factor 8 [Microcaecilia unicolor]